MPGTVAEAGRRRAGRGRRHDPVRRRGDRGRRLGQRGGDHRRIGAGHPRERRRPLGRHRRHRGHLRLDQGAHHRGAGLDLSRPHDRAGRRRRAAEDAERDRAQHPARRHDDHLRLRRRDDPELCLLCRRQPRRAGAGGAVRDPDPDDDRRAAVGDRHRRHGPAGAVQRAGDVGPRGRGGGRCRHAAARQDRHDHPRQPPGDRVPAACRASTSANWPMRRSSPRCPTRRRKAARSSCWRRRNTASAAATWRRSTRSSSRSRRRRGSAASMSTARRSARARSMRSSPMSTAGAPPRRGSGNVAVAVRQDPAVPELQRDRRAHRQVGRHAARRRQGRPAARRHPSEGHRQGRHPRALRRAAPDGHPHGDDHRRQPADRRGDRRRGRGRRFPRPGDAGGQARS